MAGPGGVFHWHFIPGNYKEVPKKGEHAAMQDSARGIHIDCSFSFVVSGDSGIVCHAVMSCYDLFMMYIYLRLFVSADRWLDVSLGLDW